MNYGEQTEAELLKLLSYEDMRVTTKIPIRIGEQRQKRLGDIKTGCGRKRAINLHEFMAYGVSVNSRQRIRRLLLPLVDLLKDGDAEIIAQSAKVLGDIRS